MHSLWALFLLGTVAFVGTMVDNLFAFAAQLALTPRERFAGVTLAQSAGVVVLFSLAAAVGSSLHVVPLRWVGLLAVAPWALAVHQWRHRHEGASASVGRGVATTFLVTLGLGGDNLAVWIALLRATSLWHEIGLGLVFVLWQGASAGALEVASMSAVASLFPENQRGSAVSHILAAQLVGTAVGPLVGVVASGVAVRTNLGDAGFDPTPLPPLRWNRPFVGALVAAAATGLAVGVYETCWSLLMHAHHATQLQIRLSWTMFCLPWVVLARVGGWIADHLNRRLSALLGLLNVAAFLATYPHIHNNVVMLFVGSAESLGAALCSPSIASLLSQGAHDRELSRRQGLYATSTTASMALSAIASGFLVTVDTALPFTLVALATASLALTTLYFWRGVPGRINESPGSARAT